MSVQVYLEISNGDKLAKVLYSKVTFLSNFKYAFQVLTTNGCQVMNKLGVSYLAFNSRAASVHLMV